MAYRHLLGLSLLIEPFQEDQIADLENPQRRHKGQTL